MKKVLEIDDCTICPHHDLNDRGEKQINCHHPECYDEDGSPRLVLKIGDAPEWQCEIPDFCPLPTGEDEI